MKVFARLLVVLWFILIVVVSVLAQDDEARQQSGLPTYIGNRPGSNPNSRSETSVSGTVVIQGLDESAPEPSMTVYIQSNGAMLERQRIPNKGAFRFTNVPRIAAILIVEIDNQEVARYQLGNLNPPPLSNRQDVVLSWIQVGQLIKRRKEVNAVINAYARSEQNQKLFDKALAASKEKKSDVSIKLFKQIVETDANDFVAWTELGSLYFSTEKYSDAENAYNKAVGLKADFGPALLNLGKLHLAQKKHRRLNRNFI
jgi:tetratricopeptide (TPR) repeat protein